VKSTTDRRIGRAAIVLSVFLVVMVGATAAVALWPRGDIELPAAWFSGADTTLVIFGRAGCPACDASTAFHQQLVATAESLGIHVIAALTARGGAPEAFAESLGLEGDHGVLAVPAPAHLTTVPTVVIVDRRGTVLQKKVGALSIDDQRALLNYLTTLR